MNFKSIKSKIEKVFTQSETKSATPLSGNWFPEDFIGSNTVSGLSITPETAMRVPSVSAAVSLISTTTGTLPPKLYRKVGDAKEVASDLRAHRLIHHRANDWTSAGQLRTQMTQDAFFHGNGFALANRVNGEVVEFLRLQPTAMTVKSNDFGEPVYTYTTTRGPISYSFRDVLHLRAITSFDGVNGRSPVALAREAIATLLVMEEHASRLFRDGARPSGVITYPGSATETKRPADGQSARLNLIDVTRQAMSGAENSGKLAILFDGADLKTLAFSSVDAQFLELRTLAIDEIARAFRVPPTMLFELSRGTWSNVEQMSAQFHKFTLLPWLNAWEDAYSRVLIDPADDSLSIEFVVEDLLRADTASRFESYSKAIAARILNPNEVRALENRAPYVGGDEYANPNTTSTTTIPKKEPA